MEKCQRKKDILGLMKCLDENLQKNIGGICNPRLHNHCKVGTKALIEKYQNCVVQSIRGIYYYQGSKISVDDKLKFFGQQTHLFGKTALFLSGGATLGKYHFGVIKALYEQDLMPRVICGSSVGTIVGCLICGMKYEDLSSLFGSNTDDLIFLKQRFVKMKWNNDEVMQPAGVFQCLNSLFQGQSCFDQNQMKQAIISLVGDLTFREIYEQNGWNFNINVTSADERHEHFLLNYLTTPEVLVWSAVLASCSIPGVFEPTELLQKTKDGDSVPWFQGEKMLFQDGSFSCDINRQRMRELFNVNTYIVSQVNPWTVPFGTDGGFSNSYFSVTRAFIWEKALGLIGNECRHILRILKNLGLLPESLWFFTVLFF